MPGKPKGPEYEAQVPAFLQRLRGEHTGDRSEQGAARPRPKRLDKGEDQDDAPTYVLEQGNENVSHEEYAKLVRESEGAPELFAVNGNKTNAKAEKPQENTVVQAIGSRNHKKRPVKIIGSDKLDEHDAVHDKNHNPVTEHNHSPKRLQKTESNAPAARKKRKVAAPALSFADDA